MGSRALVRGVFVATVVLLDACSALADSFYYVDFSLSEGLSLQGSAGLSSKVLRLTSASDNNQGSVWHTTQQSVGVGFTTTFAFQITNPGGVNDYGGNSGGDGLAFVIQNESSTAFPPSLGGGDIGYNGISNSVAVEFDTYNNATDNGDPSGNHISVQTCGILPNNWNHTYSLGATSAIPDLSDGSVHTASIMYADNLLHVYLDDAQVLNDSVDLASTLELNEGKAWVGFTAATGLAYENHDILSWAMATGAVLPGDANGNGTVDGADLNTVLSNYNLPGMTWAQGDFNGDGTVNGTDLNIVLSNYNQSAGATAAVPEPSTLVLLLTALAIVACTWRFLPTTTRELLANCCFKEV
jgi:hypothetical protein